jgi:glyoxylase-like metal-dependent hydrolase (beta-lactamase superfamily II)
MPFYKVTLGAFELIALQAQPDRIIQASQLFPTVDPSEFEREFARNSHYFGKDATELRFTQNVCAIRASDQLILVDTGIPVENDGALVIPSLKEAGISPEDITLVMLTHRDMDHVGGNLTNGKPTFPNARYVIGQSEYESYKVDPVRATFPAHITPLEDSGVLDVVADDAEVARGIRLMLTPGHRSGATSVLVGDKAILTADVWHIPRKLATLLGILVLTRTPNKPQPHEQKSSSKLRSTVGSPPSRTRLNLDLDVWRPRMANVFGCQKSS